MKSIIKKIIITLIFTYFFTLTTFASIRSSTLISDYGIVASTATFSSTTLLATTSGNVGIGTVAPTTKLEVIGSIKISSFTFNSLQYVNKISTDTTLSSNSDTSIPTEKAIRSYIDLIVPAGTISAFAGATAPNGYLLCDGSAISRTTYANLFSAIGTAFGNGNGSTTFNIPDLRGVFLRGIDNMGTGAKNYDTGRVFGSYQADALVNHLHRVESHNTSSLGDYQGNPGKAFIANSSYGDGHFTTNWEWTESDSYYNYGFSRTSYQKDSNGNIGTTETRPKNIAVNYIIKY